MGWCSGTEIFDTIVKELLSKKPINKTKLTEKLINVLEDHDWDCQSDSDYWDHPTIRKIFEKLHPDWFVDEEFIELSDVVVVMSGFRDAYLQVAIEDGGGRVTSSVSSNTTHLLISGKTISQGSSKLDKANEVGAIIMTLEDFKEIYNI